MGDGLVVRVCVLGAATKKVVNIFEEKKCSQEKILATHMEPRLEDQRAKPSPKAENISTLKSQFRT